MTAQPEGEATKPTKPMEFDLDELGTIYVDRQDRFVVSFIVSYGEGDRVRSPKAAAHWALQLTRDENAGGTNWFVYDRQTAIMHQLTQRMIGEYHDLDEAAGSALEAAHAQQWEEAAIHAEELLDLIEIARDESDDHTPEEA